MIPKRKIIRKQYHAPSKQPMDTFIENLQEIPHQLQSTDPGIRSDALSAIANLSYLNEEISDSSTLACLIGQLLTEQNPAIIHMALYAINNLIQLEPSLIPNLLSLGLTKALAHLNVSENQGTKTHPNPIMQPILSLMITLSCNTSSVEQSCKLLIEGVQKEVFDPRYIQSNSAPYLVNICQLTLEFLVRSNFSLPTADSLTPQLQQELMQMSEMSSKYKTRILALRLLMGISRGWNPEHLELFSTSLNECLFDLELEKQYDANIRIRHPQHCSGEEEAMQQEDPTLIKHQTDQNAYSLFIDAVEGLELMLEFLVDFYEEEAQFQEGEGMKGQSEEEWEEQHEQSSQQSHQNWNSEALQKIVCQSLSSHCNNVHILSKLTNLSFTEGQTILELTYRLIMLIPIPQLLTPPLQKTQLIAIIESSIITISKMYTNMQTSSQQCEATEIIQIPKSVFLENLNLALTLILKFEMIINRSLYVELPLLTMHGEAKQRPILQIEQESKQCWLSLLEIYSQFYNPEKYINTTEHENRVIAGILKTLILQIPEMQLEEWRGQAIDTLFDLYSNENFDGVFMEMGFMGLLADIQKSFAVKGPSKNKKRTRFVNAVLKDIGRFLAYKTKMIQ